MNLAHILDNLTKVIPAKWRPPPVEAQSFATLKLGQRLVNAVNCYAGEIDTVITAGADWTVTRTTNQFAEVTSGTTPPITLRVTRDWGHEFARAKAKRSAKRGRGLASPQSDAVEGE